MKAARITSWAALGLLALTRCTMQAERVTSIQQIPLPPPHAMQDLSQFNSQQVADFVGANPSWQAWLWAMQRSDQANSAIVDASTTNLQTALLALYVTEAKDAYRRAGSFFLPAVTVMSSCLNLYSETNGAVSLADGLIVRYRYLSSTEHTFNDGASCQMSTGYISEVDSARGLPIVTSLPPEEIDWPQNFSSALVWNAPFSQISTSNSYSVADLIALVGK